MALWISPQSRENEYVVVAYALRVLLVLERLSYRHRGAYRVGGKGR